MPFTLIFRLYFAFDTHLYAKPGQAIYIKGVKSTACINNICRIRCCITPDHYKNPSKLYKTAYVLHFNTIFDAKVKIFKRFLVKSKKVILCYAI